MTRPSKYGAVRTEIDGITFASKAEAKRYGELKLLASGKVIEGLVLQPSFELIVNGAKIGVYRADFQYWDNEQGCRVVEDVKGMKTPVYRLKKKLMHALHGIEIVEVAA